MKKAPIGAERSSTCGLFVDHACAAFRTAALLRRLSCSSCGRSGQSAGRIGLSRVSLCLFTRASQAFHSLGLASDTDIGANIVAMRSCTNAIDATIGPLQTRFVMQSIILNPVGWSLAGDFSIGGGCITNRGDPKSCRKRDQAASTHALLPKPMAAISRPSSPQQTARILDCHPLFTIRGN